MSRKKGKPKPRKSNFDIAPAGDDSETRAHLTPRAVGIAHGEAGNGVGGGSGSGAPVYQSVDVPAGVYVNVPKGMTIVEGCYVDAAGVMRFSQNDAPAVWHHKSSCKYHQPPCKRRITNVADIVYDDHNAPWCPDCIGWTAEDLERKKNDPAAEDKVIPNMLPQSTSGLHDAISKAIGDFTEVGDEEFGVDRRNPVTEAQQQEIMAATDSAVGIFQQKLQQRKYYPSGHPRKW